MSEIVQAEPIGLYPAEPQAMVTAAIGQADILADIIETKKLYTRIGKKNHVNVEGWTTLGAMLGVFPVVEWTHELFDAEGEPIGWEARVEARTMAGQVVGAAESECRTTEKTWKGRDSYAIRSMAQTRATSKALRLPLGFIMVLAGYDATPTEEFSRGFINQAKVEVLAMLDGDDAKTEAAGLWAAALEDHDISGDEDVKPDQIESILGYIRDAIELTDDN